MVVVLAPGRELLLRVRQRKEQFHVQTFISQATMKAFDESIFHRFSRPNEAELHTRFTAHASSAFPANSVPLSVVIDSGTGRPSSITPLQRRDHLAARHRPIRLERHTHA
jgi:hypothetical protein